MGFYDKDGIYILLGSQAEREPTEEQKQTWISGLVEGTCLACPPGCVDCPGNRQDCECYEHQEDGPTDTELRDMLAQVEDRIHELMPEIKKTLNAWEQEA